MYDVIVTKEYRYTNITYLYPISYYMYDVIVIDILVILPIYIRFRTPRMMSLLPRIIDILILPIPYYGQLNCSLTFQAESSCATGSGSTEGGEKKLKTQEAK